MRGNSDMSDMPCVEHMQKWGVSITLVESDHIWIVWQKRSSTIWEIVHLRAGKIGSIAQYIE
jgi:hypothetical protein